MAPFEFDPLITIDKGFPSQTAGGELIVAVLSAKSNRLADLQSLIPELIRKLGQAEPGDHIRVPDA
jgi:hypothetical protein